MRKLVLRCDDFGCSHETNRAIIALAEKGIAWNVSVLICGPEARAGLQNLAPQASRICLGIHLAITSEWEQIKWGPISSTSRRGGLVDANGHFHPTTTLAANLPPDLIMDEVRAQVEEALSWGTPFSYVDEHMGFNWIPSIQPRIQALADEFQLIYKPFLPHLPSLEYAPADLVSRWSSQIRHTNDFPRLLVTHPSFPDEAFRLPANVNEERYRDFQALSSFAWRQSLLREGVKLITYRDL